MNKDTGKTKEIEASQLQQADIFLCVQQEEDDATYAWLAINLISELTWNHGKIKDYQYYLPLVKLMIRVLDQNIYYHAAYFSGEKVYEEHSKDGLCENLLATYQEEETDVFRYISDTDTLLDTKGKQLIEARARHLLNTIGKEGAKGYSFQNCGVLLALCLVRIGGPHIAQELEKRIRHYFDAQGDLPAFLKNVLDKIFSEANETKLVGWLLSYTHKMLSPYWQEHSMVCSQFVANCFSHADDKNTYQIKKPVRPVKAGDISDAGASSGETNNSVADGKERKALAELEQNLTALGAPLLATDENGWDDIARQVNLDDMYTPADFALSSNTRYMGRLKL